jgi:hypothetical protein
VPDWRPTRKHALWTARIVFVVVLLLGILTLIGLPFGITLWAWVKLLIVPAVIAGGGLWFNRQQRERELQRVAVALTRARHAYASGRAHDPTRVMHASCRVGQPH